MLVLISTFYPTFPFPCMHCVGGIGGRGEGGDFVYMVVLDFLLVLVKYFGISFVHRLSEDGIFGVTGV